MRARQPSHNAQEARGVERAPRSDIPGDRDGGSGLRVREEDHPRVQDGGEGGSEEHEGGREAPPDGRLQEAGEEGETSQVGAGEWGIENYQDQGQEALGAGRHFFFSNVAPPSRIDRSRLCLGSGGSRKYGSTPLAKPRRVPSIFQVDREGGGGIDIHHVISAALLEHVDHNVTVVLSPCNLFHPRASNWVSRHSV